jgi:iron complex transport system substrate-binding protein
MGEKYKPLFKAMVIVLMLSFLLVLLCACGQVQQETGGADFPLTVTDDLDRQVTIKEEPQRIVSLVPAGTEILFALGLDEKIVGVTEYCDYPAAAAAKPKMGGFSTPSTELIVAARPDLVLATPIQKDFIRQMEGTGLAVVAFEAYDLNEVLAKIRLIGRVTGAVATAEQLVDGMQKRIDAVADKVSGLSEVQKPEVFFEIWPDPLTTGGAKSFLNSLITAAGGKNIAGDIERDWVTYSVEMLLARNPEVIIFSHHGDSRQTAEDIKARQGWEQVAAIKHNRIGHIVDENLVVRAGPRVVEGLEQIAAIIHPEFFN